jgi:gluconate 2-dehydrogenase gamma chain
MPFSRRVFVHRLTFMGGGVVLLGSACKDEPKPSSNPQAAPIKPLVPPPTTSHLTFTNDEFAVLTAACDRLIPKDDDPGAVEANVPEYIDRILQQQQLTKMRRDFTSGLAALDRRCKGMYQAGFASATPTQQDDVLGIFKDSAETTGEYKWYEILLTLTLEGFLGDPSYGGNKNKAGWKLVGFELVGGIAAEPEPGYDGKKHLDGLRCGGKKGC